MKKIEFKLIEAAQAQNKKKEHKKKHKALETDMSSSYYKNRHYMKYCEEIIKTQRSIYTLTRKKDFADILINNYILKNISDISTSDIKNRRKIFLILLLRASYTIL